MFANFFFKNFCSQNFVFENFCLHKFFFQFFLYKISKILFLIIFLKRKHKKFPEILGSDETMRN